MPRVAGLNVVAVAVAAIAFYVAGMVFYALLFNELWANEMLKNHGLLEPTSQSLTGEELMTAMTRIPGTMDMGMAYGIGFVVSLVTVIGIALVLKMAKPANLVAALGTGVVLWLCFAVTGLAYNVIYSSESKTIFMIDMAHLFTAFVLSSAVLFLIDGKALSGAAASGPGPTKH